jgi:hypothetical protein
LIKQTQVIIVLLLASSLLFSLPIVVYSSTDEREGEAEESESESEPETEEGEPAEKPTEGQENEEQERESLPYCDTSEGDASQSCHDRDDYDEDTGLYPCNDGSQKSNPDDCPDAFKETQQSEDDSINGRGKNYSPTLPDAEDLDCDEIEGTVTVIGEDVYGLDRDNDGIGCEANV